MNLSEIKTLVEDKVLDTIITYHEATGFELPIPNIRFTKKGVVAGTATYEINDININLKMFIDNKEGMLSRTIPHEVGHLIAFKQYKSRGHSPVWKGVMRTLGVSATRCHNYNMTNVVEQFTFKCDCKPHRLSKIIRNKIRRGQRRYCKTCKQLLFEVK